MSDRLRSCLRAFAFLTALAFLGSCAPDWLAAQNPAKKVPREEEEENDPPVKNRPKVPVRVDEPPPPKGNKQPAAPHPAAEPAVISLAKEAANAKNPVVKDLFKRLAVPFDRLLFTNNRIVNVGLIPDRELPADELEYLELNYSKKGGFQRKTKVGLIQAITPYEEIVLHDVDEFLQKKLDAEPKDSARYLSRPDQLEAAEKVLAVADRFHTAAVEQKKRVGAGWGAIGERLRNKLLAAKLDRLNALTEAKQWDRANQLAIDLNAQHGDDPRVARAAYRLQLWQADQTLQSDSDLEYMQLRDTLAQYERQFGGEDQLAASVRKRLQSKAEEYVKQAKQFADMKQPAQALARLRSAELLFPDLPAIGELRTRMKARNPILYVGVPRLPERMSPATAGNDAERWAVELMFEGLLQALPDPELGRTYRPELAEKMPDIQPLGRDFRLLRNARWGSDKLRDVADARDVRGTLELLRRIPDRRGAEGIDLFEPANRIEDPFRLQLTLRQGALEPLDLMTFKVLPAQWMMKQNLAADDKDFALRPFGSGPFVYAGRENEGAERGDCAVFRANPYYGQRPGKVGQPAIREIRFYVPKPSNIVADFQSGQLHMLLDAPTPDLARIAADANVNQRVKGYTAKTNRRIHMLAINHRRSALQNAKVRRGLALAIDREAILKDVFRAETDYHRALSGPFPAKAWATPPKAPPLSNPEFARQYLSQGVAEQGPLRLTLRFPDNDSRVADACRQIKDQIDAEAKKAGVQIDLTLEPLAPEVLRRRVEQEQDFDLAYYALDYADDRYRLGAFLDPHAAGLNGRNYTGYLAEGSRATDADRRLGQLLGEVRQHRDFARVRELTHEIHKKFNDQMPFIPLWQLDRHMLVHDALEVRFADRPNPVSPDLLDPAVIFTQVENWRLK